jgi:hypothetical protein
MDEPTILLVTESLAFGKLAEKGYSFRHIIINFLEYVLHSPNCVKKQISLFMFKHHIRALLSTCSHAGIFIDLFLDHEDGVDVFLRNVF